MGRLREMEFDITEDEEKKENKKNKKGIAGFVLCMVGIFVFILPFCGVPGIILNILGLIFSIKGMRETPKRMAIAGLVAFSIFFIAAIIVLIATCGIGLVV